MRRSCISKFIAVFFLLISAPASKAAVLEDLEAAFAQVAGETGPSVVSISTIQTYRLEGGYFVEPYGFSDQVLEEFLRRYLLMPPQTELQRYGLSSGIIVRSDGYILTNQHVVQGVDNIEVTLSDGHRFKAAVKGEDSRADLAILKIDAKNLPVAKLGDSAKVKTGQWVIAIGNPFGFFLKDNQPTVTVGVVSATHRRLPDSGVGAGTYYFDLIQTDAAINPGNSGGPLVNLKGEVIGINMAIFTTSGGYQGLGFAVPINVAKAALEDLIRGGTITYGWLGVGVGPLDQRIAKELGLPAPQGALVMKIFEGSPAEKYGLREMDVIRKVGSKEIVSPEDLIREISQLRAGTAVELELYRRGESLKVNLILTPHPRERRRA